MEAREFAKYSKWCWENGVKYVPFPVVSNGAICKILKITETITQAGNIRVTEKLGEQKYKQVDVYDKIKNLYKELYLKNNKSIKNQSKIKQL